MHVRGSPPLHGKRKHPRDDRDVADRESVTHVRGPAVVLVPDADRVAAGLGHSIPQDTGAFGEYLARGVGQDKCGIEFGPEFRCHDLRTDLVAGLGFKAVEINVPGPVDGPHDARRKLDGLRRPSRVRDARLDYSRKSVDRERRGRFTGLALEHELHRADGCTRIDADDSYVFEVSRHPRRSLSLKNGQGSSGHQKQRHEQNQRTTPTPFETATRPFQE